jgi:hypothetical protein
MTQSTQEQNKALVLRAAIGSVGLRLRRWPSRFFSFIGCVIDAE